MSVEVVEAPSSRVLIKNAVRRDEAGLLATVQDRLFSFLFSGLVYPQIWEDPVVDMKAMDLKSHHHVVTIASGGCNALSYLSAGLGKVSAVDLNKAHVALLNLKIAGLKRFSTHDDFYGFFGEADDQANAEIFERYLAPALDAPTRQHWLGRDFLGRKRYSYFTSNLYAHGLLGRSIGMGHFLARRLGVDPRDFLACKTLAAQQQFFDEKLAPLFQKRVVRWITETRASLFGLGIPPAQYDALAEGNKMGGVLRQRLEKLACGFPLSQNYFAWQAFGRGYAPEGQGPLPPYLQEQHFKTLKNGVEKISAHQANMTEFLASQPHHSVDRVVLLDAQDWMNDDQLNALWSAITGAASSGARVIFRTAGEKTILPGRVVPEILSHWRYLEGLSQALHAEDRSGIYGGFHVYEYQR